MGFQRRVYGQRTKVIYVIYDADKDALCWVQLESDIWTITYDGEAWRVIMPNHVFRLSEACYMGVL